MNYKPNSERDKNLDLIVRYIRLFNQQTNAIINKEAYKHDLNFKTTFRIPLISNEW